MISVDLSLVVQIVLFLILWSILRRVLFGPVGRLMAERERRTEGAHAEARALSDEGKALQEQYDAAIAKARAEGEAIKGEIREEAQRARNVIAAGNAEALAQEMAEKVLGRKLT